MKPLSEPVQNAVRDAIHRMWCSSCDILDFACRLNLSFWSDTIAHAMAAETRAVKAKQVRVQKLTRSTGNAVSGTLEK